MCLLLFVLPTASLWTFEQQFPTVWSWLKTFTSVCESTWKSKSLASLSFAFTFPQICRKRGKRRWLDFPSPFGTPPQKEGTPKRKMQPMLTLRLWRDACLDEASLSKQFFMCCQKCNPESTSTICSTSKDMLICFECYLMRFAHQSLQLNMLNWCSNFFSTLNTVLNLDIFYKKKKSLQTHCFAL